MFVRNLKKLFALFAKKSPSPKTLGYRLFLEALEDRTVPSTSGQLLWTGSGAASSAANWTDLISGLHFVPTSSDQLFFGDGGLGSTSPCTWDFTSQTVDRVIMDATYTGTLTIPSGNTLSTTNYFQQYGTLAMSGTAKISTGTYIDVYGTVTPSSATTCHLDANGDFFCIARA